MQPTIDRIDALLATTPKDHDLLALKHRIKSTGQVTQCQTDMLDAVEKLRAAKPAAIAPVVAPKAEETK